MRLWHIDLIPALPREQLVAQWRELSSIAGSIQKNGTPNHILVNFVTEYDFEHFISYAYYVRQEMTKRGYRTMESVWKKITDLKPEGYTILPIDRVYFAKMDYVYFVICFYNLLEKYMCGGIPDEDFRKIVDIKDKKEEYYNAQLRK